VARIYTVAWSQPRADGPTSEGRARVAYFTSMYATPRIGSRVSSRISVRVWLGFGSLAVTIASASGGAQRADSVRQAAMPRIIGVYDSRTGDPLSGVEVRDMFSGTYAVTSATGTAPIGFVDFHGHAGLIQLRKLGYAAKQVVVPRGDTVSITEVLEPAIELEPMVTNETYRIDRDAGRWEGLEQRCRSSDVTCIRSDALDAKPGANLADFLIRANGVTMGACGGAGGLGLTRGAQRSTQCGKIAMHSAVIPPAYCQPTFFVNGFEWDSHTGAPTDLAPNRPAEAPYTPINVKAVEVYPSDKPRPLRFQGNPTCGAVVIWTK
jgi:hypothetical protein